MTFAISSSFSEVHTILRTVQHFLRAQFFYHSTVPLIKNTRTHLQNHQMDANNHNINVVGNVTDSKSCRGQNCSEQDQFLLEVSTHLNSTRLNSDKINLYESTSAESNLPDLNQASEMDSRLEIPPTLSHFCSKLIEFNCVPYKSPKSLSFTWVELFYFLLPSN